MTIALLLLAAFVLLAVNLAGFALAWHHYQTPPTQETPSLDEDTREILASWTED